MSDSLACLALLLAPYYAPSVAPCMALEARESFQLMRQQLLHGLVDSYDMLLSLACKLLCDCYRHATKRPWVYALQGSDAVYFPAAQYDKQAIRSSAATVEEFILQTRLRLKRLKQKDEAGP